MLRRLKSGSSRMSWGCKMSVWTHIEGVVTADKTQNFSLKKKCEAMVSEYDEFKYQITKDDLGTYYRYVLQACYTLEGDEAFKLFQRFREELKDVKSDLQLKIRY